MKVKKKTAWSLTLVASKNQTKRKHEEQLLSLKTITIDYSLVKVKKYESYDKYFCKPKQNFLPSQLVRHVSLHHPGPHPGIYMVRHIVANQRRG